MPVTSVSLPVDRGCRYEGVPHFVQFGDRIQFVGGINKPKLITCTDSQGRQYKQLVGGCVRLCLEGRPAGAV